MEISTTRTILGKVKQERAFTCVQVTTTANCWSVFIVAGTSSGCPCAQAHERLKRSKGKLQAMRKPVEEPSALKSCLASQLIPWKSCPVNALHTEELKALAEQKSSALGPSGSSMEQVLLPQSHPLIKEDGKAGWGND